MNKIAKVIMVCPACLVAPLLMVGAGSGVAGKGTGMTIFIIISIILTLIALYILFVRKGCGTSKCATK